MIKKMKDPVSSLTHMLGMIAAIPILVTLIHLAVKYATIFHVVSFAIFGASLFLLYSASTIYHMLPLKKSKSDILRRIDHMMIFVLIAGTYTPLCLVPLRGPWGYSLLAVIWTLAVVGMILKAIWINAPSWLSAAIYVFMGWLVVIAFYPLSKSVETTEIVLLILGGVMYTLGAVIYAIKRPRLKNKWFGFHEIFHLFVMAGSVFHIILMYNILN